MAESEATTMSWGKALGAAIVATAVLVIATILFELIAGGSLPSWGH